MAAALYDLITGNYEASTTFCDLSSDGNDLTTTVNQALSALYDLSLGGKEACATS